MHAKAAADATSGEDGAHGLCARRQHVDSKFERGLCFGSEPESRGGRTDGQWLPETRNRAEDRCCDQGMDELERQADWVEEKRLLPQGTGDVISDECDVDIGVELYAGVFSRGFDEHAGVVRQVYPNDSESAEVGHAGEAQRLGSAGAHFVAHHPITGGRAPTAVARPRIAVGDVEIVGEDFAVREEETRCAADDDAEIL